MRHCKIIASTFSWYTYICIITPWPPNTLCRSVIISLLRYTISPSHWYTSTDMFFPTHVYTQITLMHLIYRTVPRPYVHLACVLHDKYSHPTPSLTSLRLHSSMGIWQLTATKTHLYIQNLHELHILYLVELFKQEVFSSKVSLDPFDALNIFLEPRVPNFRTTF